MPPSNNISLEIHDVAFGGKGVARHEGKVFFIPFTIPGEKVTARVRRQKKNFAEADLIAVDQPSPDRVPAPCPYFGICGGCSYQHIAYPRQLEIKASQVEQTLLRVGRLKSVPMRPAVPSPEPYHYRNRIRVHKEGGVAGFFSQDGHTIVDIEQCAIAAPTVNKALRELRESGVPDGDYSLRARGGGPYFEQTNPSVTREMLAQAHSLATRCKETLVDAYCGAGLFAKHLADIFERVIGIEENAHAIAKARRDARPNESYIEGDVSDHLGEVLSLQNAARTTVLLDPPATGVSPRVCDILLAALPSEILYVSCNPATLARDIAALSTAYHVHSVTPLDMFPQTAEIEVIAQLLVR